MKRYHILCNGFTFDCSEAYLLDYLDTLNPTKRILIRQGVNGREYAFETVSECLSSFSRQFHNAYARQQRSLNASRS